MRTISRWRTRTGPDGVLAIRRALTDAQVFPDQVVHINAHTTSTPAGDAAEAVAIGRAMGGAACGVVVSATKSMTGHLIGGAGPVESIAAICALRDGVAPPTINLEDPDDEVIRAGFGIADEPLELRCGPGSVALKNWFRVRWPQRDPGLHGCLIASCGYSSVSKVFRTSYLSMHPVNISMRFPKLPR